MTKEQKEAIDIIDKMIKSYIEADECGLSNNDFKYEIRALQTVLNLIKEQQKEIESLEKSLNDEILENYDEQKLLNKQLKQKDKIIDLVTEKLAKAYHYKQNKCTLKEKNNIDCDKYKDCVSCVKQYWERKAEDVKN